MQSWPPKGEQHFKALKEYLNLIRPGYGGHLYALYILKPSILKADDYSKL
jgi:hypothetical protein